MWQTDCEKISGWDTKNCCSTCHDDAYENNIEPCDIEIDGETLYVCCKCWEWFCDEQNQEELENKYQQELDASYYNLRREE